MENIVSVIVGLLVTMGATQLVKNHVDVGSFGATILAAVISFVVGLIAVSAQMLISGEFTAENFVLNAASIFTAATIGYRTLQTVFAEAE